MTLLGDLRLCDTTILLKHSVLIIQISPDEHACRKRWAESMACWAWKTIQLNRDQVPLISTASAFVSEVTIPQKLTAGYRYTGHPEKSNQSQHTGTRTGSRIRWWGEGMLKKRHLHTLSLSLPYSYLSVEVLPAWNIVMNVGSELLDSWWLVQVANSRTRAVSTVSTMCTATSAMMTSFPV